MAQEDLLGVDHQEAHDVVADAGEVLYLGLGDARRRDAPEALSVGLLLGYVVALHLVAASTKTSSSSFAAMKSMLSEPCAQPSSRTSMPLCLSEKFSLPLCTSDRERVFAPKARRGGVCSRRLPVGLQR